MQQIYFLSILDLHASCSKLARILQQKRLERYIIRTMFDNVMKINFMVLQVEMNRFYYLMPKSKPEVKYQNKLKKYINIFCWVFFKFLFVSYITSFSTFPNLYIIVFAIQSMLQLSSIQTFQYHIIIKI